MMPVRAGSPARYQAAREPVHFNDELGEGVTYFRVPGTADLRNTKNIPFS